MEKLLPGKVVYYLCDYWLTLPSAYVQRFQTPARRWTTQAPKWLLAKLFLGRLQVERPVPLRLEHPICVSQTVRDLLVEQGIPVEHARIV